MFLFVSMLITISAFTSSFAQAQPTPASHHTKSAEYAWLASQSSQTRHFRSEAKHEVKRLAGQSSNFPKIKRFLLSRYSADVASLQELVISSTRKIVMSRQNYHTIVTDQHGSISQAIFNTSSLKPQQAQVVDLSLSPNKDYLVILIHLNGNIDVGRYLIYELATRRVKGQFDGLSYMSAPAWNSPHELVTMHPDSSPRLTSALYVDLRDMSRKSMLNKEVFKIKDWVAVTSKATNSGTLTNPVSGMSLPINTYIEHLNSVVETPDAFFYVLHVKTDGTIFRLKKTNGASPEPFISPKHGHWLSTMQLLSNRYLLVNYSRDSLVKLVLYDLQSGLQVSELALPDNYDAGRGTYESAVERVELSVSNFLGQQYKILWDIQNSASTDMSGLPTKFFIDGQELVSRLELFTARDGERIPARITYLQSTPITGENPVYMETYGAFNYISGYLIQSLDQMKRALLKSGGILVGTGVRGGAERGYAWYLQGTGINKATPAYDLIAIADGLVAQGYTKAEKIVSTGVSAGGENVALAAQISPASFGLIIPISGGHDVLAYPELDRWGPQWFFDYLDPYNPQNFANIYARAVLEIRTPSTRYPEYFIVCGANDSRVNPAHSLKLKASLDEFNADRVFLHVAPHAGHWPNYSGLHGAEGVKTNALIWARVFDYLGLNFNQ